MTIEQKVLKLLKKHITLKLNEIYIRIPEHSKDAIRGCINRHVKKENSLFFRSGKSEYSLSNNTDICIEVTTNISNTETNSSKVISFSELKNRKLKQTKNMYNVYNKVSGLNEYELEEINNISNNYFNQTVTNLVNTGTNLIKAGFNTLSSMFNRVMHMDAVKFLKMIPDNFVDLVATDPPYPVISGGSSNKKGTPSGILQKNDGKIFEYNDIKFEEWIPELYRVMKDGSQGYIMSNFKNLNAIMTLCEKVGFKIHNLLVWKKNNTVVNSWYMKNCEYTIFFRKGRAKKIMHKSSQTVHEIDNVKGKRLHLTEKPIELADYYIKNSCVPGGVFLELFAGAGAFATSALLHGMNVLACEIDKKYQKIADARILNAIKLGFDNRDLLFDLI